MIKSTHTSLFMTPVKLTYGQYLAQHGDETFHSSAMDKTLEWAEIQTGTTKLYLVHKMTC